MFELLKEIIEKDPRWVKFNPARLLGKETKTENFGWVKNADYNNPRYDFLKQDRGIPTILQEGVHVVDPIYFEWRNNRNSIFRKIDEKESLDALVLKDWF